MSILLGIEPGRSNRAAIELAALLGTAAGEGVSAATIAVMPAGVPSPLRTGMSDAHFAELLATEGIAEARARLPGGLEQVHGRRDRSVRAGLLAAIAEAQPSALVLGPCQGAGAGRIALSDTISGLLHTAPVPVVLAPQGFRRADAERPLRRISVAFGPDEASVEALVWASQIAEAADTQLRTLTFWVRPHPNAPPPGGVHYEAQIASQWKSQMTGRINAAVRQVRETDLPTRYLSTEFGDGRTWDEAMRSPGWDDGELLIVGSRPPSGLRSTFLGSRAAEILRHSPVPVVVLPG